MPEQTQIPCVLWAQQREIILLTIAVPDIDKVDVKFEENSVSFRGQTSSTKSAHQNIYAVKIDLFGKIDPEASKYDHVGQKNWRLSLKKKDSTGPYWSRLTKDKARFHWLKTDFDLWKDEDEKDDKKPGLNNNFEEMFPGGMGSMDDSLDMDDDEDSDSDADIKPMSTENNTKTKNIPQSNLSNNDA